MLDQICYYFSFSFVRYAFAVGILIALCAALLGVVLVLKRYSMIGDGLSHVAFGATAIGAVFGLSNNMALTLPITMLAAVLILRARKLRADAAIAMLSAAALAVGYLLLNLFPASANISGDVCTSLFGSTSILTLSRADVILCAALSFTVLVLFVLFYARLFAITFDPNFAKAAGIHTERYELAVALVCAVVIVLAMRLVGALLVSALIVFPTLCATALCRSFRAVVICAALTGVGCAVCGILLSLILSTPVGATVVIADTVCYAVCAAIGRVRGNA